jgi:glutathione S-transferase
MKLYGGALSPFFRKVRVVLEEKGIPYQIQRLVPVPKTPELLAMHPMGKIPILRDGDVVVPDSSVICAYLERKHPAPALYPHDAADLAAALFFEEYADTRMSEIIGGIAFETYVRPNILKEQGDAARAAELRGRLPEIFTYLESQLTDDRDWLLPRFGIADVAVGSMLQGLRLLGEQIDAARWPRVARYRNAVESRPSFKTAISQ